ncbi:MAG TPA: succinate dehydrogenase iron-sulfur subunit [Actinomycetota bacterium]|nr:succinate dehydrogenase iron-sulfur subunit [Actinomycetota bacterium]
MRVTLRVRRYNPEVARDPWWQDFDLESDPRARVLDLLHQAKWYHDGTLTLRRSCAHAVCGSDTMMINGHNRLACKVLVEDVAPVIVCEPIRGLPVIKDLIVDMEPFFRSLESVKSWLINEEPPPNSERLQSPEERERFDEGTKCILCAACTTSCPIFWANDEYVGPAAIVNAHRFTFDSRDRGAAERLEVLADRTGVFKCRTTFNCTSVCPRDIPVTELIQEMKRAITFGKI